MKILSRAVSDKTENIVTSICKSLNKPVKYFPINKRPNSKDSVAGTVDAHGRRGFYSVWIDQKLPRNIFEADLLHELRHIVQVENGFSEIFNKNTDEFHSPDRSFIEEVGSHLSSVVLDMEVNNWLLENGYSYSFFVEKNLTGLLSNANYPYTKLDDPLNFANLAYALLHTSIYIDDASSTTLFDAYSKYPRLVACISDLRKEFLSIEVNSPSSSLLAHAELLDVLGVWKYFYAATPFCRVRTHSEYVNFAHRVGTEE